MTDIDLTDTSEGISTPNDRDKLKIASFRTKEGVWADFTAEANKRGLTATDVLKIAMEQFINGEYTPTINTGVHTLVRTQPSITRDEIQELIDTAVSTAVSTETIAANVMTAISTLSLPTDRDVSTAINTALVPIRDEISEVVEFSRNLQGEIAKVKKSLSDRVESSDEILPQQIEMELPPAPPKITDNQPAKFSRRDVPDEVWKSLAIRRASGNLTNQGVIDELAAAGYGTLHTASVGRILKGYLEPEEVE